jgi:predicted NAD/FAD-binding protein
VEHDRAVAAELSRLTTCDVNAPENELGVDLRSVWRRAFRSRAEFEATANALRVREGKPIESRSRCSDGRWTFDGATLRFSHDIAAVPPDTAMPLALHVTALANGARR